MYAVVGVSAVAGILLLLKSLPSSAVAVIATVLAFMRLLVFLQFWNTAVVKSLPSSAVVDNRCCSIIYTVVGVSAVAVILQLLKVLASSAVAAIAAVLSFILLLVFLQLLESCCC